MYVLKHNLCIVLTQMKKKNWYRPSEIKRLTGTFKATPKGISDGSVYLNVTEHFHKGLH